jgi:hypothetical protein
MTEEASAANSKPNYDEQISRQQAIVDGLAKDYEKSPTPELAMQLKRRSDTLLHLKNMAKGDTRQRGQTAAEKARKYILSKAIETPDNPRRTV